MSETSADLRFVLLRHEMPESSARASHYDLMLERADDLFTLELIEALQRGVAQLARELTPHRKAYLDFEGPVSQDRGEVHRIDRGSLTIVSWTDSKIEADLSGQTLRGRLTLEREVRVSPEPCSWLLTFAQHS